MKIGALAKATGVSVRMLRYYEQEGLLHPPRTPSGYRRYGVEDVQRVEGIVLLNGAGLPLAAIRSLLACVPPGQKTPCEALKQRIRAQLAQIDAQMAALDRSREMLSAFLR